VIQEILTEDVQEFVPYVFQILSLLLEYHNPGNITGPYMELFQFLLIPVLWERPGNIKPLVRLIQAYIRIGAAQVIYDFLIFKRLIVLCLTLDTY
jgi:exportin-2 (importin alpha re-exporter)